MRAALDEFLGTLKELGVFVESIKPADLMLALQKAPILRESRSIRKRLDYAAFIVSLYSAFEILVEALVWAHAERVATRSRYADLPSRLQAAHLKRSAGILARRPGEGRYSGIGAAEIVANLNACLSEVFPYKLNRDAVVHHDTNLRASIVHDMLGVLGIEEASARVQKSEPMLTWFQLSEGRATAGPIPESLIDLRMEDLIERRNRVTHSGGAPSESWAPDEMRERLEFLEAYSRSLFTVIAGAYLERCYVETPTAYSLGRPLEGPFQKSTIVVVKGPPFRLFTGQALFGRRNGRVDRWGEITELQVDDVSVESVEKDSPCQTVGLRSSFKLTKSMELFVLEQRDDAVWG